MYCLAYRCMHRFVCFTFFLAAATATADQTWGGIRLKRLHKKEPTPAQIFLSFPLPDLFLLKLAGVTDDTKHC